jgi:ABC-type Zn uptake system ZnuABC Zn-binding protein ZnuA
MTRRGAWWLLVLVGLAPALWLAGCAQAPDPWKGVPGSPRVVVTTAPLYSFVRAVGGKEVAVKCLCVGPTGAHHYEPKPEDHLLLRSARLFFSVGLGLDGRCDPLAAASGNPEFRHVRLGDSLPKKLLLAADEHEAGKHDHEHGHDHKHGEYDPHVWLGPDQVAAMVNAVRDALKKADPGRAETYDKNAAAYAAALAKLRDEGRERLAGKKNKRIISFHDSLKYFARGYGLEVAGVIEKSPGDEPDAGHLARVVELCSDKRRPVAAIAVEPQYPEGTSARTVQGALKGKGVPVPPLVRIDPLETADAEELEKQGAGWYEAAMRRNLDALAKALP